MVEKIYLGILADRVCKSEGLIDDKQGSFRSGRGYVDRIDRTFI